MKIAHANLSHHGISKFSFVAVHGESDKGEIETWYGRVISFLELTIQTKHTTGMNFILSVEITSD